MFLPSQTTSAKDRGDVSDGCEGTGGFGLRRVLALVREKRVHKPFVGRNSRPDPSKIQSGTDFDSSFAALFASHTTKAKEVA